MIATAVRGRAGVAGPVSLPAHRDLRRDQSSPEQDLVRGEHRAVQLCLERIDDTVRLRPRVL